MADAFAAKVPLSSCTASGAYQDIAQWPRALLDKYVISRLLAITRKDTQYIIVEVKIDEHQYHGNSMYLGTPVKPDDSAHLGATAARGNSADIGALIGGPASTNKIGMSLNFGMSTGLFSMNLATSDFSSTGKDLLGQDHSRKIAGFTQKQWKRGLRSRQTGSQELTKNSLAARVT